MDQILIKKKSVEPITDFDCSISFENTCECCGCTFKTDNPLLSTCPSCLAELSDFLVRKKNNSAE